jgi:hypothetical protein
MSWLFGGIEREIRLLRESIRSLAMSFRQPLLFVSLVHKGSDMALVYKISAGKSSAPDVTIRELSVVINGEPSLPLTFPGDTTEFGEVKADQGAEVTMTLVDIDDATPPNRSEPAVVAFVAADTIAPPKPGEFGVTLTREE